MGPQYGTCFYVTLLVSRIFKLLVDFWEICASLVTTIKILFENPKGKRL